MAGSAVSGAFGFRFMRIGVMTVKEFHDPKTQAVNVKADVSFFKIRRYGFPDGNFGMHPFNSLPGCGADAAAVEFRRHKEEIRVTPVSGGSDNDAAGGLAVCDDAEGGSRGNDLPNGVP